MTTGRVEIPIASLRPIYGIFPRILYYPCSGHNDNIISRSIVVSFEEYRCLVRGVSLSRSRSIVVSFEEYHCLVAV